MNSKSHRPAMLALIGIILSTLACNLGGEQVDSQGTVDAVYATITLQAAYTPQTPQSTSAPAFTLPPASTQSFATAGPTAIPPSPTISPTPPQSRGPVTTIGYCITVPTIDGSRKEWEEKNPTRTTFNINQAVYGKSRWTGESDLSGVVEACWTNNSLFFFARITDDVHAQTQRDNNAWKGDEVELMFDADLRGDFYDKTWDADDSQFSFNPGNFSNLVPQVWRYRPRSEWVKGINMVSQSTGTAGNYIIEAEIIWAEFFTKPANGVNYGMCFAFNDNDSPDRAQEDSLISHCPDLYVFDPTTYQTVTFAPAP